jgi:hypothetical protein
MDKKLIAKEIVEAARRLVSVDHAREIRNLKMEVEAQLESASKLLRSEVYDADHLLEKLRAVARDVKKLQRLEGRRAERADPVAEARAAYGDLHGLETRSLRWKGRYLPAGEVVYVIKQVLDEGYNDFDADRVGTLIKTFGGTWALAREYSAAVYTEGAFSKNDLIAMARKFREQGKADEATVSVGGKSYWIPETDPSADAASTRDAKAHAEWAALPETFKGEARFWWD